MKDKKTIGIIAAVVVGLLILAGAGWRFWANHKASQLSPQQEVEKQLQTLIEGNLEQWQQYAKADSAQVEKFGNDPACLASLKGNQEFLDYLAQAQKGDVFKLDLTSGAYVLYTPNYKNWDQAKLSSFTVQDMRMCSEGWLMPLYAYPDKIVWGNITCPAIEEERDHCQYIARIVLGYFTKKTK